MTLTPGRDRCYPITLCGDNILYNKVTWLKDEISLVWIVFFRQIYSETCSVQKLIKQTHELIVKWVESPAKFLTNPCKTWKFITNSGIIILILKKEIENQEI